MIIAIDASWTATGLVAVSELNSHPWIPALCKTVKTAKAKFRSDSARLDHIVQEICEFSRQNSATEIYIEDFYGGMGVKPLGRLRGAIEIVVWQVLGLEVQPVNVNQARKLLLGPTKKISRKEIKKIVLDTWQAAGAPVKDDAQADAMTVANYGLFKLGLTSLRHK